MDEVVPSVLVDSSHGLESSIRFRDTIVSLTASCLSRVRFLIRPALSFSTYVIENGSLSDDFAINVIDLNHRITCSKHS